MLGPCCMNSVCFHKLRKVKYLKLVDLPNGGSKEGESRVYFLSSTDIPIVKNLLYARPHAKCYISYPVKFPWAQHYDTTLQMKWEFMKLPFCRWKIQAPYWLNLTKIQSPQPYTDMRQKNKNSFIAFAWNIPAKVIQWVKLDKIT